MHLAFDWRKIHLPLSIAHNYLPEEIENLLRRHSSPYWLVVEDTHIRLERPDWVALACRIASIDHNAYTMVDNDGFAEEVFRSEEAARAHMLAESSSDDDSVTSAEDLVYEREAYI